MLWPSLLTRDKTYISPPVSSPGPAREPRGVFIRSYQYYWWLPGRSVSELQVCVQYFGVRAATPYHVIYSTLYHIITINIDEIVCCRGQACSQVVFLAFCVTTDQVRTDDFSGTWLPGIECILVQLKSSVPAEGR